MLIGGFYSVDLQLLQKEPGEKNLELRCDLAGKYARKAFTNNGRTATVYALQGGLQLTEKDVILVPDYLCVSVLNALEVSGAQFRFYRINRDLTVDLKDLERKMDEHVKVIYLIHYFGIPQPEAVANTVCALKERYGAAVIEDLTQTLYTRCQGRIGYGDYLVASTRKWLPVTDGGIMAVRDGVPFSAPPLKSGYDEAVYRQLLITIFRQYYAEHPEADISYYLQLEKEANAARYLDFTPREMTELSSRILCNFDHSQSIAKRRENYRCLMDGLQDVPGVEILAKPLDTAGDFVPFGFPILVEDRSRCYRYLADHGIIGEIQWILPTRYYTPGDSAQYLSDHNIMLQCDQRYSPEDMQQVVDCIRQF